MVCVFVTEGRMAILTGKQTFPALKDDPAANTIPNPDCERFGPRPNSCPFLVRMPINRLALGMKRPCSSPPIKGTNSTKPDKPLSNVKKRVSNCQPNCVKYVCNPWLAN